MDSEKKKFRFLDPETKKELYRKNCTEENAMWEVRHNGVIMEEVLKEQLIEEIKNETN